jgi:hypothetical protein
MTKFVSMQVYKFANLEINDEAAPDSARYGQWLRNGKEINQEEEEKKTFGQRI